MLFLATQCKRRHSQEMCDKSWPYITQRRHSMNNFLSIDNRHHRILYSVYRGHIMSANLIATCVNNCAGIFDPLEKKKEKKRDTFAEDRLLQCKEPLLWKQTGRYAKFYSAKGYREKPQLTFPFRYHDKPLTFLFPTESSELDGKASELWLNSFQASHILPAVPREAFFHFSDWRYCTRWRQNKKLNNIYLAIFKAMCEIRNVVAKRVFSQIYQEIATLNISEHFYLEKLSARFSL